MLNPLATGSFSSGPSVEVKTLGGKRRHSKKRRSVRRGKSSRRGRSSSRCNRKSRKLFGLF